MKASTPTTWFEEAKHRLGSFLAYPAYTSGHGDPARTDEIEVIIEKDTPRAYALLERAREMLKAYRWDNVGGETRATWLRDLEGKEERDAQDEKG